MQFFSLFSSKASADAWVVTWLNVAITGCGLMKPEVNPEATGNNCLRQRLKLESK